MFRGASIILHFINTMAYLRAFQGFPRDEKVPVLSARFCYVVQENAKDSGRVFVVRYETVRHVELMRYRERYLANSKAFALIVKLNRKDSDKISFAEDREEIDRFGNISINAQEDISLHQVRKLLRAEAGTRLSVGIKRNQKRYEVGIVLGEDPLP